MMSVRQGKRNKHNNYKYNNSQRALNLHLTTQSPLLLLLSLMLCCEVIFMETIDAAELPAELMLESVGLLKSMEHAQQHQQLQQLQQQQHRSGQQKGQMLHEQAKRFPFDTLNSASADVGIDNMQLSEMSPADFARFERELFLQSAIDETSLGSSDDVELPLEPLSMEQHADLMEHAIDYKQQHQPTAMWLQQHGSSGGDGKKAGSVFSKFHHPHQQQKHQQQHRLSGDAANSVTLAPPPMPVASPLRHCALEVCTKLRGVCQPMPTIGTACVAGDNIEVFHQDCM